MSLCHCQDVSVINTLCQCHCCCVTVSILLPAHHVSVGLCCCVRVLVSVHYVSVGVSLCQFQSISVSAMSSRASSLATSAERRWGWSSESFIMRTFQHVTFRFAVFFFLSCFFFLFFLPLGRDARWPWLANQVGVCQCTLSVSLRVAVSVSGYKCQCIMLITLCVAVLISGYYCHQHTMSVSVCVVVSLSGY